MDKTAPTYSFRPRPFATVTHLVVEEHGLRAIKGGDVRFFPFAEIVTMRLTFLPRGVDLTGFRTKITTKFGRTLAFEDRSFRSAIEPERTSEAYRAFVITLSQALEKNNPGAVLFAGKSYLMLSIAALASLIMAGGMAYFAWRALTGGEMWLGIAAAAFTVFFTIWSAIFIRRNRPWRFFAGEVPADVLPPA